MLIWRNLLSILSFGVYETSPCRVIREYLARTERDLEIGEMRIIDKKGDLFVVRLFYRVKGIYQKPAPYRIFLVGDKVSQVEELPCNPSSPYWIKGRK